MLRTVVSKTILEAMKLLQDSIHPLMSRPSNSFHVLILIVESSWRITPPMAITVGAVGKEDFISGQSSTDAIPADC